MPRTVNTTHVMTWNVLQGGGNRRPRILGQIAESKATIVGLTEIRRKHPTRGLEMFARSVVANVNHEEVEHIESTARLWLTRARGFSFVGEVDWLSAPMGYDFAPMQADLDLSLIHI